MNDNHVVIVLSICEGYTYPGISSALKDAYISGTGPEVFSDLVDRVLLGSASNFNARSSDASAVNSNTHLQYKPWRRAHVAYQNRHGIAVLQKTDGVPCDLTQSEQRHCHGTSARHQGSGKVKRHTYRPPGRLSEQMNSL